MANSVAWMATNTQLFATRLLAWFVAFTRPMTLLLALVDTAPKCSSTDLAATSLAEPTRLILEDILATQTWFRGQVNAFRAFLFVPMTVVTRLWMATVSRSLTFEAARGRLCATWQWRLKNSSPAMTAEFDENGIAT